ncbi:MAG: hypothetical protein M3Y77_05545 [Actinomycetota bacterium]|nr:hypothetical protein [Actinomycetota bacterium]
MTELLAERVNRPSRAAVAEKAVKDLLRRCDVEHWWNMHRSVWGEARAVDSHPPAGPQ